jgi:hypothetical protein
MFIVERSSFRLTKTFYIAFAVSLIVLGAGAAWWGVLLTMHIHLGPKIAPENLSEVLSSSVPEHVPECDLPPLPESTRAVRIQRISLLFVSKRRG